MKYLFLLLALLLHTAPLSSQSNLLASVEILEVSSSTTPPIKKKHKKTKKKTFKKKKRTKKHSKKVHKTQNTPKDFIKIGLLFNLIGTSSICTMLLIVALLFWGSLTGVFLLIVALVTLFIALIFLTIFLVYISVKRKNQRNPKETVVIKKTEEALRAEVPYLPPNKVNLYLTLNENLTTAKIQKNILMSTKKDKNAQEWAATKLEIKDLEAEIKEIEGRIKELHRQNKTMQVRSGRE